MNQRLRWLLGAALVVGLGSPVAATPAVFVETGALLPLSSTRKVFGEGGFLRVGGGKVARLSPSYSVGLFAAGSGNFFDHVRCRGDWRGCSEELGTILSLTAGPRFFLHDGNFNAFVGANGGYYRGVTSGISEDAGGFAIEMGFLYALVEGTAAGAFIRREEVFMKQAPRRSGSGLEDLQLLHAGLGFEHRFAPPLRAVSHPRRFPE